MNDRRPDAAVNLRLIDPTAGTPGGRVNGPTAQALLDRIIATSRTGADSEVATGHDMAKPLRGPRPHRRWLMAGSAAAVLAAGAVVVPGLGGDKAYASWTAVPSAVSPDLAHELARSCIAASPNRDATMRAALSERRGDYTFTLVATDQSIGSCLWPESMPGVEVEGGSSWGELDSNAAPSRDGVLVLRGGQWQGAGEDHPYTTTTGRVGSDVASVVVTPDGGQAVQATVEDGYFMAWWPGRASDDITIAATLVDGTTAVTRY